MTLVTSLILSGEVILSSYSNLKIAPQLDRNKQITVASAKEISEVSSIEDSQVFKTNLLLVQSSKFPEEKFPDLIPRQTPKPLPRELPEAQPSPLQPNNSDPQPESNTRSPNGGKIVVDRFEFIDNTAFTSQELAEATKNLLGKPLSFAELLEVEQIVTRLYIDAGYINSGAYLPAEQSLNVNAATVKVQIVEGSLKSVRINGTDQLRENYIRDRLPATKEKPLNQKKLLRDLQLLQLNPLIESISAQLSAGARPEASYLTIDITEADTFSITTFIDNGRSPSVSSFRRGIKLQENNFLGFGDRLNLTYSNTDGSNTGDLNYEFPLNHRNGSISLAAGINDTKIVESPFESLDIVGDSFNLDVSLRQPIIFEPTQELSLGVTLSYQDSETQLPGNNDTQDSVSAVRFFQEFTQRNPTELIALRSQLSVGLDLLDSTTEDNAADSRFVSWRGQTQYVKLLAPETFFILRGDLQLSNDRLLAQEQFSLGGFNTVRGHRQNFLLTDSGALASAEIKLPIWRFNSDRGALHLIPFFDIGKVWNIESNAQPDPQTLISLGMGLELSIDDSLNARIDWGIPLTDVNDSEDNLQENGIHFSLDYRL